MDAKWQFTCIRTGNSFIASIAAVRTLAAKGVFDVDCTDKWHSEATERLSGVIKVALGCGSSSALDGSAEHISRENMEVAPIGSYPLHIQKIFGTMIEQQLGQKGAMEARKHKGVEAKRRMPNRVARNGLTGPASQVAESKAFLPSVALLISGHVLLHLQLQFPHLLSQDELLVFLYHEIFGPCVSSASRTSRTS